MIDRKVKTERKERGKVRGKVKTERKKRGKVKDRKVKRD